MRPRASALLLVAMLIGLLAGPIGLQRNREALATGDDPANSGVMPGPGPDLAKDVVERWRITESAVDLDIMMSDLNQSTTGVAVVDGVVYFGAMNGSIRAVDLETGEIRWTAALSDVPFRGIPAVADGTLYLMDGLQVLYAVDTADGSLRWSFDTETGEWKGAYSQSLVPSPVVSNGTVYLGNWNGVVYAIDAETGTEVWKSTPSSAFAGAPAVADGRVFVVDRSGNVRGFDAATGAELWTRSMGSSVTASIAIADGVAYLKPYDRVVAVDPATGDTLWEGSLPSGDGSADSGLAVDDGVVVLGTQWNVFGIATDGTGQILWQQDIFYGGAVLKAPPVIADGIVYVVCPSAGICLYDLHTGAALGTFRTDPHVTTTPAVVDGMVVLGVGRYDVVALSNPSDALLAATEDALASEATATAAAFASQTATAEAQATQRAVSDVTATAVAAIQATEQARDDAWAAYFTAIGTTMAGALPPSMSLESVDVSSNELDDGSDGISHTGVYDLAISGSDAGVQLSIMVMPDAHGAEDAFAVLVDSATRSGWEAEDDPESGEESACVSLVSDGSASANCVFREGDMVVASEAHVPTDNADAALLNATDLLQIASDAIGAVERPAV